MGKGGRKRIYTDGTRWEMVPLPKSTAELLIDREKRRLRDIIVDAVRDKYPQLWPADQTDKDEGEQP